MGGGVDAKHGGSWRPAPRAFGAGREAPYFSALTLRPGLASTRLFDHLVGDCEQRRRGCETERLGGSSILDCTNNGGEDRAASASGDCL